MEKVHEILVKTLLGNFGVDKSLSYHTDDHKSNFSVLLWILYYGDDSYYFAHGKEIFKLKANNENFNFLIKFFPGFISNEFGATDPREVYP